MILTLVLAVVLRADQPRILAVASESLEGRPAVHVVAEGPLREVGVAREGSFLVLSLRAAAPKVLPVVAPEPPLTSIRVERVGEGLAVRIGVPAAMPFEVRRQEAVLTVLFGERGLFSAPPSSAPQTTARGSMGGAPAPTVSPPNAPRLSASEPRVPASPPPTPSPGPEPTPSPSPSHAATPDRPTPSPGEAERLADVRALYARIFPAPASSETAEEGTRQSDVRSLYDRLFPAPAALPAGLDGNPEPIESTRDGGDRRGFALGILRLRPQADFVFVDAETALETETPVHDSYFETRPRIGANLPLGLAQVDADYEARIRRGSAFDIVDSTTHLANVSLGFPFGVFQARGTGRLVRGTLETAEVDPGREYFFRLGRFTHAGAGVDLRSRSGARLDLRGTLGYDSIDLAETAGFVSHDTWRASTGVWYELTPESHLSLVYAYERVPAANDRPEIASTSHGVGMRLEGEIVPLLTVGLGVGYERRRHPEVAQGTSGYSGLVLDGRVAREFGRASSVTLAMSRDTYVSAFEQNGFYISSALRAEVALPLPFSVALRGSIEHRWNDYRTPASEIGEARRDRLFGWTVGVGRAITRWSFLRADYRRDRRRSNLDRLDTDTDAFTVELGLGAFREARP